MKSLRKCCEFMKATSLRSGDREGQKNRQTMLGPLKERTGKKGLERLVRVFLPRGHGVFQTETQTSGTNRILHEQRLCSICVMEHEA